MHRARRPRAPRRLPLVLPVLLLAACAPGEPAPAPEPVTEEPRADWPEAAGAVERARDLLEAGEPAAALRALLEVPHTVPDGTAETVARLSAEGAARVPRAELEEAVASRDVRAPALPPTLGELALALHFEGREAEARERARAAVAAWEAGGSREPGPRIARAVLEGRVDEVAPPVVVGLLLPVSGSPTFQRYARLVEEGVRAAVADRGPAVRRTIRVEIGDDGGLPEGAASAMVDVSARGPLGVVGPLVERGVWEAVRVRSGGIPMISPTARMVPEEAGSVYSMAGFDPGAAHAAAGWATAAGLRTAAVVRPDDPAAAAEARAFREAFSEGGGRVVLERTYPPGSSHFRDVVGAVDSVRPAALFLPLPPEDVPLLAPQLTFFGLDSLGVQVLGNRSWTAREAMEEMDPRHLEAVIVATTRFPGERPPGWDGFVRAYEEVNRRSLRGEVPAYGYDAASLLLEAAARGGPAPEGVRRGLERIRDFPGATGVLSVRDGRIVRRHEVVVFEEGAARPVGEGEVPAIERRDLLRERREGRREMEERRVRPRRDPPPRPQARAGDVHHRGGGEWR